MPLLVQGFCEAERLLLCGGGIVGEELLGHSAGVARQRLEGGRSLHIKDVFCKESSRSGLYLCMPSYNLLHMFFMDYEKAFNTGEVSTGRPASKRAYALFFRTIQRVR